MARARAFCFTANNPSVELFDRLGEISCRYLLYGREVAPTTGTRHLQGYIYFTDAKSCKAARRILTGMHVERARGTFAQNRAYCTKSGDFVERGEPPTDADARGSDERNRWAGTYEKAKEGNLSDVEPDILIRNYNNLKRIKQDHLGHIGHLESVCGIWIYGSSGSGKTHSVFESYPNCFSKPRSIWWDGYAGEDTVLIDDLDKYDVKLGGKLKHWADRYAFIGEAKGTSVRIRPKRIIVTSQYRVEDIWDDFETQEALHRRFKFIHKLANIPITLN